MTHDELRELYELYVLGVLAPDEQAEVEEHLERNCPECSAGVRHARALSTLFASLAEPVEPSKRLRRRVLASVGVEPVSTRVWIGALGFVSCCLAIALVVAGIQNARKSEELNSVTAQLRQSTGELSNVQAALQLLREPETRQVLFSPGQPQPPRARFFVNPQHGVLLVASHLPAVSTGKTLELWLLPKTGTPIPAGLFQPDAQGNGFYLRPDPIDVGATKGLAVTLEPAGGSNAPTTAPFIVAGLAE